MKAISLHQPWAFFAIHGFKSWETRSWATNCFETVLIHASQKKTDEARKVYYAVRAEFGDRRFLPLVMPPFDELPRGGFVGQVEINCVTNWPLDISKLGKMNSMLGDFSEGRWFWKLNKPVPFKQIIPSRGYQRFWNVDESSLPADRFGFRVL